MPVRTQRTRTPGGGMPPGSRYVGRGPGQRFGNPNRVVRQHGAWAVVHDNGSVVGGFNPESEARRFAVEAYRHHLKAHPELVAAAREELAGRDLACWCALPEPGEPDHCHASVLITLAAGAAL
jgi:hypothetical protein